MSERVRGVKGEQPEPDEMRSFLLVVRRALLLIVAYIEVRCGIEGKRS